MACIGSHGISSEPFWQSVYRQPSLDVRPVINNSNPFITWCSAKVYILSCCGDLGDLHMSVVLCWLMTAVRKIYTQLQARLFVCERVVTREVPGRPHIQSCKHCSIKIHLIELWSVCTGVYRQYIIIRETTVWWNLRQLSSRFFNQFRLFTAVTQWGSWTVTASHVAYRTSSMC